MGIIAEEISAAKFPCSVLSVQRYVLNDKAVAQDGAELGKQLPEGSLQSWAVAVVAGLLSSSCCVLQMAINLLSYLDVVQLGCAGFNKVLGPIRTPLRVLTLAGVGMLWRHPKKRTVALLIQTCLTIGIMVAPELLLISGGPALAPATGNTVRQLAHKHGSVLDVNVSVNDGTATVQSSLVHTDAASEFDIIAEEISAAKFPCSVLSVQRYVPNDKAVAQDG